MPEGTSVSLHTSITLLSHRFIIYPFPPCSAFWEQDSFFRLCFRYLHLRRSPGDHHRSLGIVCAVRWLKSLAKPIDCYFFFKLPNREGEVFSPQPIDQMQSQSPKALLSTRLNPSICLYSLLLFVCDALWPPEARITWAINKPVSLKRLWCFL